MSLQGLNEWAKANPWKWAGLTLPLMFLILFAVGALMLGQPTRYAAAFAAMYALVFALFSALSSAYRRRKQTPFEIEPSSSETRR